MEQTPEKMSLKIGPYQICPIPTGLFALDGGSMFGTVPKILWQKTNPADDHNRIDMEARALLLKGDNGINILIDTGNGEHFVEKYGEKMGSKFAQMYRIDPNGPSLQKSLEKFNVSLDQVHYVILTHLHFDHCGGSTTSVNNEIVPTFPSARYFIQEKNLQTAQNPNVREKASYLSPNFEPLIKHEVVQILHGDTDNILPHVSVFVSNGHTQGQQLVKISDEKNTLIYCGDLIPTSSHIRSAWVMGYDLYPLQVVEEKTALLSQATSNSWYLYFEHDPFCDLAQVEKQGADFSIKQRFRL